MVETYENIDAEEVHIGKNVTIAKNVKIKGAEGKRAEQVFIGDNVFIDHDVKILVPKLYIGDYSKIHNHCFLHGYKPMQLGRNFWLGQHSVLDSIGGLDVDDFVGIGAMSQVWTHIRHGDPLEGCKYNSSKYARIGKDVWFVGHSIVSPIIAEEKSIALIGSVVTKNMLENHIYAGVPAQDVTDKIGQPWKKVSVDEKYKKLTEIIKEFEGVYPQYKGQLQVVKSGDEILENKTCFNVANRTYNKRLTDAEVTFLNKNSLIKFTPLDELRPFQYQY